MNKAGIITSVIDPRRKNVSAIGAAMIKAAQKAKQS